MTRYTPLWLQQGNYPASVDRALIGALWPNGGVSGMAVTAGTGMTVNVASGRAAVPTVNGTGTVLCSSDAVEVATLTAAPPGGQNRYDLVTVQPRGNDLDGGANNDWILNVVTGTAAASPTVPTVPAGQLALAQVYVPGGSASVTPANIVDLRKILNPGAVGVIGWAEMTTAQTGLPASTEVDITGLAVTFTPQIGHRYRYSAQALMTPSAANGTIDLRLSDAANTLICRTTYSAPAASSRYTAVNSRVVLATAATPITVKARAVISGGGEVSGQASPAWLLVEDIG